MARTKSNGNSAQATATIGFEAKLLAGSIRVPRIGSGVPADPLGQYARANAEDPDEP